VKKSSSGSFGRRGRAILEASAILSARQVSFPSETLCPKDVQKK
jgi:hypothetical protein